MIVRSWICDNAKCGHWFDSGEPNPKCPICRCVRTSWRPNGGHIGGAVKGADAELRALADIFKLDDMNSAERGRAAKKVNTPAPAGGAYHTFAPGFTAAVNPAAGAQCVPSANNVDFKVKSAPGTKLSPNPDGQMVPVVEARHRP
jgi:hypothetical protein